MIKKKKKNSPLCIIHLDNAFNWLNINKYVKFRDFPPM